MYILDVSDAERATVLHKTGLAPFNMAAKLNELRSFLCLRRARLAA